MYVYVCVCVCAHVRMCVCMHFCLCVLAVCSGLSITIVLRSQSNAHCITVASLAGGFASPLYMSGGPLTFLSSTDRTTNCLGYISTLFHALASSITSACMTNARNKILNKEFDKAFLI